MRVRHRHERRSRIGRGGALALGTAALVLLAAAPAAATRLMFEAFLPGQAVPASYGDRVSLFYDGAFKYGSEGGTTPNVSIGYTGAPTYWGNGYGDLIAIAFIADSSGTLEITMTADPGWRVELSGFELGGYQYADHTIDAVEVLDQRGSALFSQTDALVRGGGLLLSQRTHSALDFGTPLSGRSLTIRIDASNLGVNARQVGIDNVVFSQVQAVPEPGAAALVGVAGLAAALVVRRRR